MPNTLFDLSLVLPAYNERATILQTIDEAFTYFSSRGIQAEIIVAADGDDGTRELVREAAAHKELGVIGHRERRGKGRGVKEAIMLARGRTVGYADADNKVPITEFDKIRPWLDQGYEVVIGSRAMAQSQIEKRQPWFRRLGAKGFYYFLQAFVGLPGVTDSQCGFKFFPRAVALRLFELQRIDGYMFDVEILALAQRIGYRIMEVPIRWHDDGDSRLQLFRGNVRNAVDLFRIRSYCRGLIPVVPVAATASSED
jgi:dolichyl-phosphate beta-glucosyltransferase